MKTLADAIARAADAEEALEALLLKAGTTRTVTLWIEVAVAAMA